MIPTFRSLVAPTALAAVVREAYGLAVRGVVLVRSFVNDVYEVTTPDRRCVLKLYRHGWWSPDEVAWEVDLVGHLAAAGVPVPGVRPMVDGRRVGSLDAPEGPRPFTLSDHVEGGKPREPFDAALYTDLGRVTAALHDAADRFRTTYRRPPLDLRRSLDEPLAAVLPALAGSPADQALVRDLAAAARRRVTGDAAAGLDWGVCHGDVTLDNVLITADGLTIHDFDQAGESWRAADLVGVAATPFWDDFTTGYTQRRGLGERDRAAIPWLGVIATIGNLRFHLVTKPALRGTESVAEGWVADCLDSLRSAADTLR